MGPVEFVLWLNGAAELVGDQPPTPEQWATMREKLGEAVGGIVAARLLERAEETLHADARRKNGEAEKREVMKQMMEMAEMRNIGAVSDYQLQMEAYKAQVDLETQKMLGLARALPVGIIFEVPEMLELHNLGLTNHILGKGTT